MTEPTTPLVHDLPMRWADLDQLGHVNNVTYVDYAAEARAVHVADGDLQDRPARTVSVEYLRPLLLSSTPVRVTSADDGDRLVQEIAPATATTPFARATWHDEPLPDLDLDLAAAGEFYDLRVRRSDLGPDGDVTVEALFEFAQEARIVSVVRVAGTAGSGRYVVARVDVRRGDPFTWGAATTRARSVVTRVGRSSFTVTTLFDDGRQGRADAVLVGFDLETQTSRVLGPEERAVLEAQLS
ncbi:MULTISPECIES: acyl-ACP thioesterase domain-containing protein [unclassified Aeromicrobium]|uniref:acyl-ACP thioesterase domain-containing protein n=1 Tax=unclassified Aeromicrobium TaxID=2633570 RepID=UPI002096BBDF|nr:MULTISPECIES: acyl-ACP thioesterase domain-containing protein [unclassified Aeromicrobium]MCO7240338.1 thioesterase [Aeromicrobium sp. CnD17-E]MDR6118798.1 acyl-CoA thioester hydrolase [Aeromicrobium sp. SORGH_AS_0981]